jgi:hypothetical protein
MKRITLRTGASGLALILVLLALPYCKKSGSSGNNNASGYYLKFKLNGTQLEFDSQPIAGISYSKTDSLYTCVIAAYKDVNAGLKNAITVTIFSNSAITAGSSYNDPAKARRANGGITPQNTLFYYDSTANAFLTMGLFASSNGSVSLPGVVANAHLTITELTASYLKGTFSGTVYRSGSLTQNYSITAGECYLRRTQ